MTTIVGRQRGRPRKSSTPARVKEFQQTLEKTGATKKIDEEISNWEGEGGSVHPEVVEEQQKFLDAKDEPIPTRQEQWNFMDRNYKSRVTEDQFMESDNITGFGPDSYFTPPSKR